MRFHLTLVLLLAVNLAFAQYNSPVEYMSYLDSREETLSKKYLGYMSEIAHGNRARKLEKRRQELLTSIQQAIREGGKLKPYKGDVALRDAYKEYWTVLLSVFKEDYDKIIDMEEVAERSYDAMEAVLLTEEMAEKKLQEAYSRVPLAYKAFAAANNVRLNEGQTSKLARRLDMAGAVNKYVKQVYLIYFKSTVQERLMLEALNAKDLNAVEQSKNSMQKFAVSGLALLDTLKPYKNDGSLMNACRKVLEFQKNEAPRMTTLSDFLLKEEEFLKLKKSFDSKPAQSRTQKDVDAFNKAVNDMNASGNNFNKVNTELNNSRTKVLNNWESAYKRFLDQHMPHNI